MAHPKSYSAEIVNALLRKQVCGYDNSGTLGANTSFWFICPYSWVTRLMVPTLGILPNGESVTGSALSTPLPLVIMTICLSLLLLYTISKSTAKSFIKQEVL